MFLAPDPWPSDYSTSTVPAATAPHDSRTIKLDVEQDIPRRQTLARDALEHGAQRCIADLARRLPQRRQRHRQQRRKLHVVNPDHAHVLRDCVFELDQRLHEPSGGPVVGADDSVGTGRRHQLTYSSDVGWVETLDERAIDGRVKGV